MVMTSGKGSYVTTEGGKTWLDFTCGSEFPSLSLALPALDILADLLQ